jgi:hypothetical protein
MEWELQRHEWSTLRAAGSAAGVPNALRALAAASTPEEARRNYWRIDTTVVVDGAVYQAALATAACVLQALPQCTDISRRYALDLLVEIGGGVRAQSEVAAGEANLVQRCLEEVVRGFPMYVDILERPRHPDERVACVDLVGLSCRAEMKLRNVVSGTSSGSSWSPLRQACGNSS